MDMSKYVFYTTKNKVIAVSTYAGKIVKGVAKCNPNDNFDLEKGKKLAAARCNAKVAEKRRKRAVRKCEEAKENFQFMLRHFGQMNAYVSDAKEAEINAKEELNNILKSF